MQRLASKLQLRQGSSSILTDKQQQEEEGASSWGDDAGTLKSPSIIMSQYTYTHQSLVYALGWSSRREKNHRLAVGSFRSEQTNFCEILELSEERNELVSDPAFTFRHDYPPTKLMFIPDKEWQHPDLLATSGEYLRIWRIADGDQSGAGKGVHLERLLNNGRQSEFCAPLTSFDWNEAECRRIGTSSIDTTVTIWDIERGEVETQLIAHDREVFDIAWGGPSIFATVSADGSVRVFDLRDKDHSTIIYETPSPDAPLLRLDWNRQDPRYMATMLLDSPRVIVLDIRFPTLPVAELARHTAPVNAIVWAPHTAAHICSAGDDHQALIWDMTSVASGQPPPGAPAAGPGGASNGAAEGGAGLPNGIGPGAGGSTGAGARPGGPDPILSYSAPAEISSLQWSAAHPDFLAICFGNKTRILRV